MIDARRMAYLDAMGIDVWLPRGAAADPGAVVDEPQQAPGIQLGPGEGEVLCLASTFEEARSELAGNISRAMRSPPGWSWPSSDAGAQGYFSSLREAVAERLITRVLIFGEEAARELLGGDIPDQLGTARIHLVAPLTALQSDMDAKRALWSLMRDTGMAAPPGSKK